MAHERPELVLVTAQYQRMPPDWRPPEPPEPDPPTLWERIKGWMRWFAVHRF